MQLRERFCSIVLWEHHCHVAGPLAVANALVNALVDVTIVLNGPTSKTITPVNNEACHLYRYSLFYISSSSCNRCAGPTLNPVFYSAPSN